MFRKNYSHLQTSLDELPDKQRARLEASWAGAFYKDFFSRIDDGIFERLHSEEISRPNTPVNLLVGFEVLKAGHGWSDEEAYDALSYNLQVRYALGLSNVSDTTFTLRTVYNFRRSVAGWMTETGENLFEAVFNQVTGEQLKAYELRNPKDASARPCPRAIDVGATIRYYLAIARKSIGFSATRCIVLMQSPAPTTC